MVLSEVVSYYYMGFVRNVPTSVLSMVRGFLIYFEKDWLIFILRNTAWRNHNESVMFFRRGANIHK